MVANHDNDAELSPARLPLCDDDRPHHLCAGGGRPQARFIAKPDQHDLNRGKHRGASPDASEERRRPRQLTCCAGVFALAFGAGFWLIDQTGRVDTVFDFFDLDDILREAPEYVVNPPNWIAPIIMTIGAILVACAFWWPQPSPPR